ncbi:MAG: ATP-binding protein [Gemmataceae bacterium]|nr:ATP-binding protein [Gemmataceae bacterium]
MKFLIGLFVVGCLAICGCNKPPVAPSQPATTAQQQGKPSTPRKSTLPPGFNVIPSTIEIKPGETKTSTIKIEREGEFEGEINLEFDTGDTDLKIDNIKVGGTKTEVEVSVIAGAKAKSGLVEITATAKNMDPKPYRFQVTVPKK